MKCPYRKTNKFFRKLLFCSYDLVVYNDVYIFVDNNEDLSMNLVEIFSSPTYLQIYSRRPLVKVCCYIEIYYQVYVFWLVLHFLIYSSFSKHCISLKVAISLHHDELEMPWLRAPNLFCRNFANKIHRPFRQAMNTVEISHLNIVFQVLLYYIPFFPIIVARYTSFPEILLFPPGEQLKFEWNISGWALLQIPL
eukprot:UN01953